MKHQRLGSLRLWTGRWLVEFCAVMVAMEDGVISIHLKWEVDWGATQSVNVGAGQGSSVCGHVVLDIQRPQVLSLHGEGPCRFIEVVLKASPQHLGAKEWTPRACSVREVRWKA